MQELSVKNKELDLKDKQHAQKLDVEREKIKAMKNKPSK
jgi:hypothetical protein